MLNPKEKLGYSNSIPARDYAIYSDGPQVIKEIEKKMHNNSIHRTPFYFARDLMRYHEKPIYTYIQETVRYLQEISIEIQ
jgi:hypothetical protein